MKKFEFIALSILYTLLAMLILIFGKESFLLIFIVEFFLGIYQVSMSIIKTIQMNQYSRNTQLLIKIYWLGCIIYFLGLILIQQPGFYKINLYNYILGAWPIALYYSYITYCLAFPKYIKSHLDIR